MNFGQPGVFIRLTVHLLSVRANPKAISPRVDARIAQGEDIHAIFRQTGRSGAIIRVSFSGSPPSLPRGQPAANLTPVAEGDKFYPDDLASDGWT